MLNILQLAPALHVLELVLVYTNVYTVQQNNHLFIHLFFRGGGWDCKCPT